MSDDLVVEDHGGDCPQLLSILFLMESSFSIVWEPTNEILCPSFYSSLDVSMTAQTLKIKKDIEKPFWG